MTVTVRLFARARQLVGSESIAVDLPDGVTIANLRQALVAEHPSLESLSSHLLFAVGTDYVTDESTIDDGADIAVFPPVSGG